MTEVMDTHEVFTCVCVCRRRALWETSGRALRQFIVRTRLNSVWQQPWHEETQLMIVPMVYQQNSRHTFWEKILVPAGENLVPCGLVWPSKSCTFVTSSVVVKHPGHVFLRDNEIFRVWHVVVLECWWSCLQHAVTKLERHGRRFLSLQTVLEHRMYRGRSLNTHILHDSDHGGWRASSRLLV